jgi:hypothetical protein
MDSMMLFLERLGLIVDANVVRATLASMVCRTRARQGLIVGEILVWHVESYAVTDC